MEQLTHIQVIEIADAISAALATQRIERKVWDRWIQVVLGFATGVSLIFSLGLNWGRIGEIERRMTDFTTERRVILDRVTRLEAASVEQNGKMSLILFQLESISKKLETIDTRLNSK